MRFPAIDDVTKKSGKQMRGPLRVVIKIILKCGIYLHRVVIVYAGVANINACQAEELLNLICFHPVIPQHLPTHTSECSVRVRHKPAAEFFPTWLDGPWVAYKHEYVRINRHTYRI